VSTYDTYETALAALRSGIDAEIPAHSLQDGVTEFEEAVRADQREHDARVAESLSFRDGNPDQGRFTAEMIRRGVVRDDGSSFRVPADLVGRTSMAKEEAATLLESDAAKQLFAKVSTLKGMTEENDENQ
jgi:hypothetical protein